jgi:uncharacterized membrane protein YphA (DoxX/SURF4 family)
MRGGFYSGRHRSVAEKVARRRDGDYRTVVRALLERVRPFAPLTLRLAIAAVLCTYGGRVLFREMAQFHAAVATWGLPRWVGHAAVWSAFLGGALIGVGFLTRLAAFACTLFTALILIKTKLHAGWQGGLDLPVLALGALVSLVLSGAGRWSLDHRLFGRSPTP